MTKVNFVSIGAKINPSNSKIIPLEHRVKMRGDYPHLYVTKHARVGKNKHLLHSICVEQYSSHQPPYTAWTLNEIRETYEFPNRPAARWIVALFVDVLMAWAISHGRHSGAMNVDFTARNATGSTSME